MKKGKLLFLLIAILSVALLLVSCDGIAKPKDTADTTSDTTASPEQDGEMQQEEVKHDMHKYFNLKSDDDDSFTKVLQLEGELVDVDEYNQLIALRTYDLNVKNEVVETVTVYDIEAEEVIAEYSVANLYATSLYDEDYTESLVVDIDYPIIGVKKTSYSEDGYEIYDYSYYFAKKDGALIRQTNKDNYERFDFANGLVAFDLGDDMVWIDRNMEIVRTVDSIAANGYDQYIYRSEYQGYLYTWDDYSVHVFSPAGLNTAKYTASSYENGFLNVHVLDDGDVLIQDVQYVDDYTACDFTIQGERAVIKSYVMSLTDGKLTEVELDYFVNALSTRYAERYYTDNQYMESVDYLQLELAEGYDNQAIIYKFANGKLAYDPEYVVLSNDLIIEYTVPNKTAGRSYNWISVIDDNLYMLDVYEAGYYQTYLFDMDGNMITPVTDSYDLTDKYIVTDTAIYDHQMNVVYEIPNIYEEVEEENGRIFFYRTNFLTGAVEVSVFDEETMEPTVWLDGTGEVLYDYDPEDEYYATYDPETETYRYYAWDDTLLLSIHESALAYHPANEDYYWDDDVIANFFDFGVVTANFNGDDFVFILK